MKVKSPEGESFRDVVRRLTRKNRSLLDFAGDWKDFPPQKFERYLAFLEAGDRPSKGKLVGKRRS